MLAQIGTALPFEAWFTKTKLGATGLTVTVDVYRDGTSIVTGASATAIGGGLYSYTLASGSNTAAGNYVAIFKTSDTTVDMQHVPSMLIVGQGWVERVDASINSRSTFAGGAVASVTGNIGGNVAGSVGSVTADVTVGTNNDKDGYSLTTEPPTAEENAAAVWAAESRTLTGFGSLVADIASAAATAVWGAASRTLSAFGFTVATNVDPLIEDGAFTGAALANSPAAGSGGLTDEEHAKLFSIGAGSVTTQSPTTTSGVVSTVIGGDYYMSDGRGITLTMDSPSIESLGSPIATVKYMVTRANLLTLTAAEFDVVDGVLTATFEMSKTQTRLLTRTRDAYTYYVEAVLENGHEIPLSSGKHWSLPGGE